MALSLTKSSNFFGCNLKRLLNVNSRRLKSDCDSLLNAVKNPCKQMQGGVKIKKENANFKSMWDNPDCCKTDPCKEVLPRYDELYYRMSDKEKRKYTCTWVKCPTKRIVVKKTCCLEDIKPVPVHRRPRKERTPGSSSKCPPEGKCPTINIPGCRQSRLPPSCVKSKSPADCKKPRAPFPSFSECKKDKPRPKHPTECKCGLPTPTCRALVNEIKRKAKKSKAKK